MSERFDRVAVVTGAAQGIGECIARRLAEDGASLLLCDVQDGKVAGVAASLREAGMKAESLGVDVADPSQARAMIARALELFGGVDALVNAITPGATGNTGAPLSEGEKLLYDAVLPLGTGGPRPTAEAVRFLLRPSGDWISGAVLNVSGGALRGM